MQANGISTAKLSITGIQDSICKEANDLKVVFKQNPKPTKENWKEILQSMQISFSKIYKEPPTCIEIIQKDGSSCSFGSLGNFSVLIGKAKSRKTFLISLFLASYLDNKNTSSLIKVFLPKAKERIIAFDTEQSQYDVHRVTNRILNLSGSQNPLNFEVYSLRALSPQERLFIIEQKIYDTDDVGIVVIDGIRDLISDINSPDEATMITSKLLKWTEEKNIHIISVLHQNKGDNNARGHVGSELVNKAESVVSVEKDNELSIVKPEYFRGKDFQEFAFSVNDQGLPYILEDWAPGNKDTKAGNQKLAANNIPDAKHKEILSQVFKLQASQKYSDLLIQLKLSFQQFGISMGDNRIREFITFYLNNQWIIKVNVPGKSYQCYNLKSPC